MTSENVTKEQWVAVFQEIGLDENGMQQWHRAFEQRNPDGHREFLIWLGIPQSEIAQIRSL